MKSENTNGAAATEGCAAVAGSGFAVCCGKETRVIDSRRGGRGVRRRRMCSVCGKRYTTMEVIAAQEDEHILLGSDMAMFTALKTPARHAIRALLESLTKNGSAVSPGGGKE